MEEVDVLKPAIVYHYYEANQTYKDNLIFFLNNAIDNDADYYIYISGDCSVNLIDLSNVKYINIENKNNDFGGVVDFVAKLNDNSYSSYIFINSSTRGPFLPTYYPCKWYEVFSSRLSDKIALVGSSINLLPEYIPTSIDFINLDFQRPFIHVQTTAYAFSPQALKILRKKGFFDENRKLTKNEVIELYELRLSQELLKEGLNVSSLLPTYEEFSSSMREVEYDDTSQEGDPLYESAFHGRSISPLENVFVKTNRNAISDVDLASYTFTSLVLKKKEGSLTADGVDLLYRSHRKTHENKRRDNKSIRRRMGAILRKILN